MTEKNLGYLNNHRKLFFIFNEAMEIAPSGSSSWIDANDGLPHFDPG
jgi:hypothetical protein